MPVIYGYPTSNEIELVEQKLIPKLTSDSPLFEFFPFDSKDEELLIWEQKDNFTGLQQLRGWNGLPPNVQRISASRYIAEPGVYGEKIILDERELTNRRRFGTLGGPPIPISDMVGEAHEQLLNRRINLVEFIGWQLLIAGSFTVANTTNGVSYGGSYTQQAFTPSVPWSTLATATPLADLRTLRGYEPGQSVTFGTQAKIVMNWVTLNYVLNNTNANDLGGKRAMVGSTLNSVDDVNRILVANDIAPITVYNGGYIDDTGTWNYFVPTGKVLVVGRRTTGRRLGYYRYTRNINSPNAAPAPYVRTIDRSMNNIPGSVEVHDGHNGGPVIQFPGCVVKINAA